MLLRFLAHILILNLSFERSLLTLQLDNDFQILEFLIALQILNTLN
ncbi:MAG: hypothetical protein ACEY3D_02665 [Rickettsia sp.]